MMMCAPKIPPRENVCHWVIVSDDGRGGEEKGGKDVAYAASGQKNQLCSSKRAGISSEIKELEIPLGGNTYLSIHLLPL